MNRIEYKVDIDKSKKIDFLNFLLNNKATTLYEKKISKFYIF